MKDAQRSLEPVLDEGAGPEPAPSDRDLLLRHRAGDPDAFGHLVASYQAPVYAFLYRSGVPDCDREDVFQDIFIKVHRAAHQYDAERDVHPWIFTIVVNTTRSYFRRRKAPVVSSDSLPMDGFASRIPSAERTVAAQETVEHLHEEILALPMGQREALLLAVLEGMSMRAIGDVLDVSENTVRTWLRRARARLMERIGGSQS